MTFYCIYQDLYKGVDLRIKHLSQACHDLSVDFVAIDSQTADYSALPRLRRGDFLYNVARGSQNLELLLLNEWATTFYIRNPEFAIINDSTRFSINHAKHNLPAPKTVFDLTADKALLRKYVDYLGGFPVVLKATGGTLGVGTVLASDFATLFSVSEYICSLGAGFIMRQYIHPSSNARLIVIGDKVVASCEKFVPERDFRTRAQEMTIQPKQFPHNVQELAIKATQLSNFENAGVDILIDSEQQPYLLEVNMPHDFAAVGEITSTPIATIMVKHLISKLQSTS